ncbi:TadE/TadG family type IV pilus assembly protein [Salinarimonas ramus]|uniref:Flp pilus assembly protein TadG n=1 Tax=Salinarimonas ramus TaxID=690164 RepID=A0A917QKN8_9HYPH|nr:VWA domain-containing protein [Salinarimonas ramus]GGK53917.1 hypothetical protein GCM10011322_45900 [Salinarimonas ramus]
MSLRRHLRDAVANRSGNVAIAFGLVLVPLLGMAGATIDYTRARNTAETIQLALDNAALAAVRDPDETTREEMLEFARKQLEGVLGNDAKLSVVSLTGDKVDETVWLEAEVRVETTFLRVVNIDDVTVSRFAEASYGRRQIEIALVLDNTGSMSSRNKMRELKRALCGDASCSSSQPSSGFVHVMREAARGADRIRVGLVPFDTTVRVPLAIEEAVADETPLTSNVTVPPRGRGGFCTGNAVPTRVERVSWLRFAAADKDAGDGCDTNRRATPTDWDGCVWDRDRIPDDFDVTHAGVDLDDPRTLHPASNCRANLARMAPLTDVWTSGGAIVSAIGSMQPSGNTNVTIGAVWGAAMLSPSEPFTESLSGEDEEEVERFMILLTDGDNTENKFGDNNRTMDERTEAACTSAKDAGITVVTVRVINGNAGLLRRCASSSELYYDVSQASDLGPVFDEIARRIGSVRLTQ